MDIFSHGLWGAVYAKAFNQRRTVPKPISWKWTVFWGVFPDLFAFTIPFIAMFGGIIFGDTEAGFRGGPPRDHTFAGSAALYNLAFQLYNFSHSAVVYLVIVAVAYYFLKRFPWETIPWLFHILLDLPTHTTEFFPTPIVWPVSSWRFNGTSWSTPWILAINYGGLLIAFLGIHFKSALQKAKKES